MRLNEIKFDGQPPIDAYGSGYFRVRNEIHTGNLLLLPTGQSVWGGYDDLDDIIAAKDGFDVIFIGTGADVATLPAELIETLNKEDVFFEQMSSPSASRTFNILLSEGRRVAAALLTI